MSRTIDEKVVEMRFDNANFEQNVQTSMGTLSKLKNSLNFDGATKSLENIDTAASNVSFETMAAGIESLQQRFSALGIIGMTVLQNLTNAAMDFVKKGLNYITDGIVSGGIRRATNLENAHFQLQGLLKDEEAVAAIMDDVDYGVKDTAYSLDAAAKVASQLAASGMRAGEDMRKALRGISGVAAMTNSDYESIGEIYTTIAGNGRLMGMQLTQLAARGLNAAAILGEQLGKTEAEIREMTTKGEIDFQTFADAMDNAFGEHAKAANETFTGSLSNIKSALARIGALFVTPIIEQNGPVVELLNAIRVRINDIKNGLVPLANIFTNFVNKTASKLASFFEKLKVDDSVSNFVSIATSVGVTLVNVFSFLNRILEKAKRIFKNMFPNDIMDGIVNFFDRIKTLSFDLKISKEAGRNLSAIFKGLFSILKLGIDILKSVGNAIKNVFSRLTGVPGTILDIAASIGRWITSTVNAIEQNGILETVISGLGEKLGNAVSGIRDFLSQTNLLQKAGEIIRSIFSGIGKFISELDISGFFGEIGTAIKNFINNADLKFALNGGVFTALLWNLKNVFVQIRKIADRTSPFAAIGNTLSQVRDTLFEWERSLSTDYFLKIGAALLLIAAALLIISGIDSEALWESMGALTVLMGELVGFMKLMKGIDLKKPGRIGNILLKLAAALLLLALALRITAGALKIFAEVAEMDTAWEGFGLMAASLALLVAAMWALSKISGKVILGAAAILIMAVAMAVLAVAVGAFALVAKMDSVWTGVGVMAASLGILVVALLALSFMSPTILIGAASILIMAVALIVLAAAIAAFALVAKMDSVWTGVGVMAASLGILVVALLALSFMSPTILIGAAAILIMSVALLVLAAAIGAFAIVASMGSAWAGIGLMAVALIALTAACLGLSAIAGPVLAGAAVLLVMAIALAAFSAALIVAGAGITAISAAFSLLGPAILALATGIGESIAVLGEGIGSALDDILTGIAAGIEAIIAAVGEGIGKGLEGISKGITAISESISDVGTSIGDIGDGITRFGDGVRSLEGISWVSTATGMLKISGALKDLNENKFDGDTGSIESYASSINGLITTIENLSTSMTSAGTNAASSLGRSFVSGISGYYAAVYSAGQNLGQGFADGIRSKISVARAAAAALATAAEQALCKVLVIKSPSRVTHQFGEYFDQGFANGINDSSRIAEKASENLGKSSIQRLKNAISKASEIVNNEIDSNPVITPILDLSDVKTGASDLNSILSKSRAMALSSSINLGNADEIQNGSSGTVYTFTQNNYSPKALSRVEIYRQTKNQFSTLKGMVKT